MPNDTHYTYTLKDTSV